MHEENKVNPKVVAAGGRAGVGYAVGVILVHYLERASGAVPERVEDAMLVVAVAALAGIAGYLKAE